LRRNPVFGSILKIPIALPTGLGNDMYKKVEPGLTAICGTANPARLVVPDEVSAPVEVSTLYVDI
jgi:hypothetical protein